MMAASGRLQTWQSESQLDTLTPGPRVERPDFQLHEVKQEAVQQVIMNSLDVEDERKMPAEGLEALSKAAMHLGDEQNE